MFSRPSEAPNLHVKLGGANKFAKVVIVKDNEYVYSTEPGSDKVEFSWRDNTPSKGKDQLLLRPRRAGQRRTRLGIADVDHLHGEIVRQRGRCFDSAV